MAELTFVQFMVALFMGLGALCVFIWAVLSGLFVDVEKIAYRAYRAEVGDDDTPD
ncbi:MAG TPA: cbb3-type cytochrome oxidase assembly protein CcoS [Azospirillum sp.]|nr:cbb3-type cytochrome oxidase assembly protein CcoS [Azospirillum sp.]